MRKTGLCSSYTTVVASLATFYCCPFPSLFPFPLHFSSSFLHTLEQINNSQQYSSPHTHIHTYTPHTHTYTHTHIHTHTHTHIHTHKQTHTDTHRHIHIHTHTVRCLDAYFLYQIKYIETKLLLEEKIFFGVTFSF